MYQTVSEKKHDQCEVCVNNEHTKHMNIFYTFKQNLQERMLFSGKIQTADKNCWLAGRNKSHQWEDIH